MTIYDALSQEYGLSIYHDYLLDSNCELLAEMCLNQFIELDQVLPISNFVSRTAAIIKSRTGSKAGKVTLSASGAGSGITSWFREYSYFRSRSYSSARICKSYSSFSGSYTHDNR